MTDEQKSRFCDEYCKYADEADKYIKAAKNCTSPGVARQELTEYATRRLQKHCDKCVLNEVDDETID